MESWVQTPRDKTNLGSMLCAMRSAEFEFGKGRITQDSDWGDRNVVIPLGG